MKIMALHAREIFDSRGFPTIECIIKLENNIRVSASVPSGTSRGMHEALELRDGGTRLAGLGAQKAVTLINEKIAPLFIGKEPECIQADQQLIALDDTSNKATLGANTMLAVSMAMYRAHAAASGVALYELIAHACGFETVGLPVPMCNIINGGLHADSNLQIQEFMIVPFGMQTLHETIEAGIAFSHALKSVVRAHGKEVAYGDEGGVSCHFTDDQEALDMIMATIAITEGSIDGGMLIALDVAASRLYDAEQTLYNWQGKKITSHELIDWYATIAQSYPLYAIEDGMSEIDWQGWMYMREQLGEKMHIIGDDIFVTNPERIWQGIERDIVDGVIIKPNQIGTITETLQAVTLCKENDKKIIVSHRSGETNDDFIADLAVGVSATHIKAGGFARGERMAKYNRLLVIERELVELQLHS